MWSHLARLSPTHSRVKHLPVGSQTVVAHLFGVGTDAWVTAFDPETRIAYGFVSLGLGKEANEWGFFRLETLMLHLDYLDLDSSFKAGLASDVISTKHTDEAVSWRISTPTIGDLADEAAK